jgi:hypothetical protein
MKEFKAKILEQGWSGKHVREVLRKSDEYRQRRDEIIITKAYHELLAREPDKAGFALLKEKIEKEGWGEDAVRNFIKKSPEYKERGVDAVIQQAFKDILGRPADPGALETYRKKMTKEGWTEERLRKVLKESPEYKQKHR